MNMHSVGQRLTNVPIIRQIYASAKSVYSRLLGAKATTCDSSQAPTSSGQTNHVQELSAEVKYCKAWGTLDAWCNYEEKKLVEKMMLGDETLVNYLAATTALDLPPTAQRDLRKLVAVVTGLKLQLQESLSTGSNASYVKTMERRALLAGFIKDVESLRKQLIEITFDFDRCNWFKCKLNTRKYRHLEKKSDDLWQRASRKIKEDDSKKAPKRFEYESIRDGGRRLYGKDVYGGSQSLDGKDADGKGVCYESLSLDRLKELSKRSSLQQGQGMFGYRYDADAVPQIKTLRKRHIGNR